tara:strand:+ start:1137 stop:1268 length:132 start_codon:yes stop_codon:yes gene_type:complete
MSKKKITIDERIDALKKQLKQIEASYFKVQGAIEVLEGMKQEN